MLLLYGILPYLSLATYFDFAGAQSSWPPGTTANGTSTGGHTNFAADLTIDGDASSFWKFTATGGYPQITITMPEAVKLTGLKICAHGDNWPAHYKVEGFSSDLTWEQLAEPKDVSNRESTAIFGQPFQSSQFRFTVYSAAATQGVSSTSSSPSSSTTSNSASSISTSTGDDGNTIVSIDQDAGLIASVKSGAQARAEANLRIDSSDQATGTSAIQTSISEIYPVFANESSPSPALNTTSSPSSASKGPPSSSPSSFSTSHHPHSASRSPTPSSTLKSPASNTPTSNSTPTSNPTPSPAPRGSPKNDGTWLILGAVGASSISLIILAAMAFRIRRRSLRGQPQIWTGWFKRIRPPQVMPLDLPELANEISEKELDNGGVLCSELMGSNPPIAELDAAPKKRVGGGNTKKSESWLRNMAERTLRRYTVV